MLLENFIPFIHRSPTVYHAAKEISSRLLEADFTPLAEPEKWHLEPGKGYFVMREDALLAAFRLPKKKAWSATVLASHLDSPALKLKPHPELSAHGLGQLGVEVYGAPLLHTWLDRDLSIAGRLVVQTDKKGPLASPLVFLDDYPVIIPSLAIHLQRDINEKGLLVHKQEHLKAIFTLQPKEKHLEQWLRKHQAFDRLLGFDLYLVPLEKGAFLGFENELISSYRLDNLTSAFASLAALLTTEALPETIQMAIFWDHEEIGSQTYAGADSLFANQIIERIALSSHLDREEYHRLKSRSLCLSCDVGHALHPNFSDKYDLQNAPSLGRGPTLKFSSRYATSGATAAQIVHLADKRNIPLQTFASRSDIPSGSTVGAMMAANLGIPTVDLGIGCWAMHSIRETVSAQDLVSLYQLLRASLEEPWMRFEEI